MAMENNNQVTKADLKVLRDELMGAIHSSEKSLRDEMKGFRDELVEMIHDTETKLLRAFYGFAETTQQRLTEGQQATSSLANRLAILERRMTDLEKQVNFPNAP